MYNRYIPADTSYAQVREPAAPEATGARGDGERRPPTSQPRPAENSGPARNGPAMGFHPPLFPGGREGLASLFSGKERGGLSGLLKALRLENIDPGDVLLLLIVLYLLVEGDDLELVIALGLVLIMGLGDEKKESP